MSPKYYGVLGVYDSNAKKGDILSKSTIKRSKVLKTIILRKEKGAKVQAKR